MEIFEKNILSKESKSKGYEALFEYPEIFSRLCGAIIIQAIRDRAMLEKNKVNWKKISDTKETLDKWFESEDCKDLCYVLGFNPDFKKLNWEEISNRQLRHVYAEGI